MPSTRARPLRETELREFYDALTTVARLFQFRDREYLIEDGVTVTECYTLEAVIRHEALSVSGVAEELRLDKSTASRTIDALEQRGLVTRTGDPAEHRAWLVSATGRGRQLHKRIVRRVIDLYRGALAKVPASRRRDLIALLGEVAQVTRRRLGGPGAA